MSEGEEEGVTGVAFSAARVTLAAYFVAEVPRSAAKKRRRGMRSKVRLTCAHQAEPECLCQLWITAVGRVGTVFSRF